MMVHKCSTNQSSLKVLENQKEIHKSKRYLIAHLTHNSALVSSLKSLYDFCQKKSRRKLWPSLCPRWWSSPACRCHLWQGPRRPPIHCRVFRAQYSPGNLSDLVFSLLDDCLRCYLGDRYSGCLLVSVSDHFRPHERRDLARSSPLDYAYGFD